MGLSCVYIKHVLTLFIVCAALTGAGCGCANIKCARNIEDFSSQRFLTAKENIKLGNQYINISNYQAASHQFKSAINILESPHVLELYADDDYQKIVLIDIYEAENNFRAAAETGKKYAEHFIAVYIDVYGCK